MKNALTAKKKTGVRLARRRSQEHEPQEIAGQHPLLHLQRAAGNRAVLQLLESKKQSEDSRSIPFPHAPAIESSLGMGLKGTATIAPEACAARGVEAFTEGAVTHFGSQSPSLHVAAHEAAHQLQHAGVVRDAGLGAEGHAHAVAGAVASGASAAPLMGRHGSAVGGGMHAYTELTEAQQTARNEWKVGPKAKVGDEGRTATNDNRHECWAEPSLIAESNAKLKARGSGIDLSAGSSTVSGNAPDGSGWKTLNKVDVKISTDTSMSGTPDFWTDCGRASREVQGPTTTDTAPKGVYDTGEGVNRTTSASKDPAVFRDEIYMAGGLGSTPEKARKKYVSLSDAEKEAFDKKHGINRYAAPAVGEAFVARRDDAETMEAFNWHWATTIMQAGGDRVTFENFAKPGTVYGTKDEKWFFETYGPPAKAGQTFYDREQTDVGAPGKNTTIMVAQTQRDPELKAQSTPDLIDKYSKSSKDEEKRALAGEIAERWIRVAVDVKKVSSGGVGADDVFCEVIASGNKTKTAVVELNGGQSNTFWVPLEKLVPFSGAIELKVWDEDLFFDDLLVWMSWPAPYAPFTNARTFEGGDYKVTISFLR
ncbi:MAG TPA: hypothetical protein VGN90_14985 [Pyrinomonadaceae bacterium]|jgi:hypothetical protein|nr:hypothetical protein [Pyrinomonadaceae bacterium]